MHWTITAAAQSKFGAGADDARFTFGETAQHAASSDPRLARFFEGRAPHLTLYGPAAAASVLADERVDLSGEGGAQIVCRAVQTFVNVFTGRASYERVVRDAERTLGSDRLALSLSFDLPAAELPADAGDAGFALDGRSIFLGRLPLIEVVARSIP